MAAQASTGERILVVGAGESSTRWAALAGDLGHDVVCVGAGPDGAAGLGGLLHLLWWDPSVRAVLVAGDETTNGPAVDVDEVRRAIELTGSDAVLFEGTPPSSYDVAMRLRGQP
jgi:aspartate aminotransferase-like enzyme